MTSLSTGLHTSVDRISAHSNVNSANVNDDDDDDDIISRRPSLASPRDNACNASIASIEVTTPSPSVSAISNADFSCSSLIYSNDDMSYHDDDDGDNDSVDDGDDGDYDSDDGNDCNDDDSNDDDDTLVDDRGTRASSKKPPLLFSNLMIMMIM